MKYFPLILILVFALGCSKTDGSLFRWQPLAAEADSLVVCLERKLVQTDNPDSLRPLSERLTAMADRYPDIKQLRGRDYYWRAKMYQKYDMDDSMDYWMGHARLVMDSAKYPYDYVRLNLLHHTEISRTTIEEYSRTVTALHYAKATSDPFLEAHAMVSADILKTVLEIPTNGDEIRRASEIYSELGLESYAMRMRANLSLNMLVRGDSAGAFKILKVLLDNPSIKSDKHIYKKVLFDAGLIVKSPEYMAMAAECSKDHDKKMEITCRWYEGCMSRLKGNPERADSIAKALLPLINLTSREIKSNIFYDNMLRYEREGKADSALMMLKMYAEVQDTLAFFSKRDEMIRIDMANRLGQQEERANRMMSEARLKWLALSLALLVVGLACYILLSYRLRKERERKEQVETELGNKSLMLESVHRTMMSQGLAMTEKDNVLQSVSDYVGKLENGEALSSVEVRKLNADIRIHLNGRQEWEDFKELFSKVHPGFADELVRRYPDITEGDIRLAIYIKSGLSTKQIARMLMVQPSSVKMNRHRLRERMGLTTEESLEDAIRQCR